MENISLAISIAKTQWLKQYLTDSLPELDDPDVDYWRWFNSLISHFESRRLLTPSQQKNYLSQTRKAIAILDPDHPALEVVNFDKNTWTEINNSSSQTIADRTTKLIQNPEVIVQTATDLLKSFHWSEIAAGLAVLTGRRCTEVIATAQFKYISKYILEFSGSLKRKSEPIPCVFEIPTLADAQSIINAIKNLRKQLGEAVDNLSVDEISKKFSTAVARQCDRYFREKVPLRDGKENLYTHLFRSVYATIAAHWFCPPHVPVLEYRAAIQGHYQILDEENPQLRRSIAAARNYFDYQIGDGKGNIDGRLGIKLHQPDVEVISPFAKYYTPAETPSDYKMPNTNSKNSHPDNRTHENKDNKIPTVLEDRLVAIGDRLGTATTIDTLNSLLDWAEVALSLSSELNLHNQSPQELFQAVEDLIYKNQNKQTKQLSQFTSNDELVFTHQSVQHLCRSIELLASAVNHQRNLSTTHLPSSKPNSKDIPSSFEEIDTPHHNDSSYSEQLDEKVNHAIDCIMDFNNQPDLPQAEKWYIGIGSLRQLTGTGQTAIYRALSQRQEEIERHHQHHQLGKWHNARGRNAPKIYEVVSLNLDDYRTNTNHQPTEDVTRSKLSDKKFLNTNELYE